MSNVPEDFEVLFGYECHNPKEVESHLHNTFKEFRHRSKNGRETEFFYIGCLLNAKEALRLLKGTKEIPREDITLKGSNEAKYDKAKSIEKLTTMRPPFTFDMVGIKRGTTLVYTKDENEKCTVVSDRKVKYKNKEYSLSSLVKVLTGCPEKEFKGPIHFKVKGEEETLNEKRERIEEEKQNVRAK